MKVPPDLSQLITDPNVRDAFARLAATNNYARFVKVAPKVAPSMPEKRRALLRAELGIPENERELVIVEVELNALIITQSAIYCSWFKMGFLTGKTHTKRVQFQDLQHFEFVKGVSKSWLFINGTPFELHSASDKDVVPIAEFLLALFWANIPRAPAYQTVILPVDRNIRFPANCIRCASSSPTGRLRIDVSSVAAESLALAKFVGGVSGALLAGGLGGWTGSQSIDAIHVSYEIPACERCLIAMGIGGDRKLQIGKDATNPLPLRPHGFEWRLCQGRLVLALKNEQYAKELSNLNRDKVSRLASGALADITEYGKSCREAVAAPDKQPPSPATSPAGTDPKLASLLDELLPDNPVNNWHRHPYIPDKKLGKAIAGWTPELQADQVLGLGVGSMGSVCLLTVDGIYYKSGSQRVNAKWKDIREAVCSGEAFKSYPLRLTLVTGEEVTIRCAGFEKVRPSLEQLVNRLVHPGMA